MKLRIKEVRESLGMNQKDFAESLGIKPTTFNGYETGAHDPKSDILSLISSKYGVSIDYMLGTSDKMFLMDNITQMQKEMHPSVNDECMLNMLSNEPKVREFFEFVLSLPEEKKDKFMSAVMSLISFDLNE